MIRIENRVRYTVEADTGHDFLFQKHSQHFFVKILIRLITHRKIQPCFFIDNTFVMSKGIKTGFSVIAAHAAFAESPEPHFAGSKMNDYIIDTSPAESGV